MGRVDGCRGGWVGVWVGGCRVGWVFEDFCFVKTLSPNSTHPVTHHIGLHPS